MLHSSGLQVNRCVNRLRLSSVVYLHYKLRQYSGVIYVSLPDCLLCRIFLEK